MQSAILIRTAAMLVAVTLSARVVATDIASDRMARTPPDISGVWGTLAVINPATGGSGIGDRALSPAGQAIVDAFRNQYDLQEMEPNSHCVEPGMPSFFFGYGTAPIEIVQQDARITILAELGMQVRRIYLNRTEHPDDFPLTRVGHSIGHWESDTLVVETALLTEWLMPRWPHSDQTRITERLSLKHASDLTLPPAERYRLARPVDPTAWVLVNEITLTDSVLYAEPQQILIYLRPLGENDILEDNCIEGLWWEEMEKLRRQPQ